MTFTVGQRIHTTVNAPPGWPDAYSAPTGTPGTITDTWPNDTYGVLLDTDPDQMPATYHADELRPV